MGTLSKRSRKRRTEAVPRSRGFGWQRLIVPVDFSRASLDGLRLAAELAQLTGASLHLVFVLEKATLASGLESVAISLSDEQVTEKARKKLEKLAGQLSSKGGAVSYTVVRGKPYEQILREAQRHKADLIVQPAQGHSRLERLLMGSTAERVIRHASCPVLVVRS